MHKDEFSLWVGTFLINVIFFSIFITAGLFFFDITITQFNIISAGICSLIFCWFQSGKSLRSTLLVTVSGVLILAVSIGICAHSFDFSWDGNTYHKTITGFLKNGWNPLMKTFYDFADSDYPACSILSQTWLDAYPKGSEIFAACIYTVTRNIEGGKCFNILSCAAIGFISYGIISKTLILKNWQAAMCSVLLVLNPVVCSQFFTYYIDGFLWQIFLLNMFCLLYLTLYEEGRLITYCCYMLIVSIVIGLNLKFSSLLYFGIPGIAFFAYWCFAWRNGEGKAKDKTFLIKRLATLAVGVVLGIGYVGANSYIINIIRHQNPVYTMLGEGSTDLVTVQLPKVYQNMNNIMRFIGSLFSKTNGSKTIERIEWKIPFTVHSGEFSAAQSCDVRTAGWGILFSGVFLISTIVIIVALICYRKTKKKYCQVLFLIFFLMLVSVIFVPGLSWARYFGALFYIPVIAISSLCIFYNKTNRKKYGVSALVLSLLLCLNLSPNIVFSHKIITTDYSQISAELEEFKKITEENPVIVGYNHRGRFSGRIFTLDDKGIFNYTFGEISPEESYIDLFPYYGLIYRIDK